MGPASRLAQMWGAQSRACQRHHGGCVYQQNLLDVKPGGRREAGGRTLGEQGVRTMTPTLEADPQVLQ